MKQVINVGASSNDGTGDTLRVSQQKANSNFTELYDKGLQQVTDVNATTTNEIAITSNGIRGVGISPLGSITINSTTYEGKNATITAELLTTDRVHMLPDKDGVFCIVNTFDNFANDTAAATGGIAIGQYYHTAGVVKIRLT
jgi:acetyltransferase-like isoleucine patch superfamily enzyme